MQFESKVVIFVDAVNQVSLDRKFFCFRPLISLALFFYLTSNKLQVSEQTIRQIGKYSNNNKYLPIQLSANKLHAM